MIEQSDFEGREDACLNEYLTKTTSFRGFVGTHKSESESETLLLTSDRMSLIFRSDSAWLSFSPSISRLSRASLSPDSSCILDT